MRVVISNSSPGSLSLSTMDVFDWIMLHHGGAGGAGVHILGNLAAFWPVSAPVKSVQKIFAHHQMTQGVRSHP